MTFCSGYNHIYKRTYNSPRSCKQTVKIKQKQAIPLQFVTCLFFLLLLIFPLKAMQSVFTDNSDNFCLFHKLLFATKILEIKLKGISERVLRNLKKNIETRDDENGNRRIIITCDKSINSILSQTHFLSLSLFSLFNVQYI